MWFTNTTPILMSVETFHSYQEAAQFKINAGKL